MLKFLTKNKEKGFALFEIVLAVAFMTGMSVIVVRETGLRNAEKKDLLAASHFQSFIDASKRFMQNAPFCPSTELCLTDGTASTATDSFTVTDLRNAGYLSSNFSDVNNYNQQPVLIVQNNGPDERIEALVAAAGGNNMSYRSLITITNKLGGESGYYLSTSPNNIEGRNGWTTSLSDWGGPLLSSSPTNGLIMGRIAYNISLTSNTVSTNFLHRDLVPGFPEANQMNTDIGMNGNDILNIGPDQDSTTPGVQGFDASTAIFGAAITAIGQEITKPTCKTGQTPQIFVSPLQAEDVSEGQPLVGVRAYAEDLGTSWRTRLQVKTYRGWLNDISPGPIEVAGFTQVMVKCTKT